MANDRKVSAGRGADLAARRPQDRLQDHAAIDHLADELLPALVAKLGANGLGELEVREGTWRVRLRMPADRTVAGERRLPGGRQGGRATDGPRGEHQRADPVGTGGSGGATSGSEPSVEAANSGASRVIATAPAVGYFRPRANLRAGTKVRAGDRIGIVDVLGIGQDVVAPGDGLIGATLVGPGEPVEYGQGIIVLEQIGEPRAAGPAAAALEPVATDGASAAFGAAGGPADRGPAGSGLSEQGVAGSSPADSGPAGLGGPADPGPADPGPAGDATRATPVASIHPGGHDDSDGPSPAGAA